MTRLNLDTTIQEESIIYDIVSRIIKRTGIPPSDRIYYEMDLIVTHKNGCPLDLIRLLNFPDMDFFHDIQGIKRHLDRRTGKLKNCFLPRCSKEDL